MDTSVSLTQLKELLLKHLNRWGKPEEIFSLATFPLSSLGASGLSAGGFSFL